jgi:hypothetical protein
MSGLEFLGAVAAAVQLAGLCYQSEQRVANHFTTNRIVINTIRNECVTLSGTIDEFTARFSREDSAEERATSVLRESLSDITHDIDRWSQRTKLFKILGVFGSYEANMKERLSMALQLYQTRISLCAQSTLLDIRELVSTGFTKLPPLAEKSFTEIVLGLSRLNIDTSLVKNALNDIERRTVCLQDDVGELRTVCGQTRDHARETHSRMISLQEELNAMKEIQLQILTSRFTEEALKPRRGLGLGVEMPMMDRYLQSIWLAGGETSDQDIWECFHDVISAVQAINVTNKQWETPMSPSLYMAIMLEGRPSINANAMQIILRMSPRVFLFVLRTQLS